MNNPLGGDAMLRFSSPFHQSAVSDKNHRGQEISCNFFTPETLSK
jgi:hypothetical protein